MDRARFLLVGGFLGAGKTTAVLRLASRLKAEGRKVGILTNDQAAHLVDTSVARASGFRVEEVAGACFCCKFDELELQAAKMRRDDPPDFLIGEPVGSCTDLAATVVQPLRRLYGDRYSLAPYSVLVDPTRARQLLVERGDGGFSDKVAYIFRKQLEEADLVLLNKVDLLSSAQREELLGELARAFPKATALAVSAATGEGFDRWCRELAREREAGGNVAEVDYDLYAAGEAELGWLNLSLAVEASEPIAGEALVREVVSALRDELARRGEVAHAKVLFEPEAPSDAGVAIANFVGADSEVFSTTRARGGSTRGRLLVNARVHLDPVELRRSAERALDRVLPRFRASHRTLDGSHFRPGRPIPLHRFGASATP